MVAAVVTLPGGGREVIVMRLDGLADWLFPARDVTPAVLVRSLSERETGPPADNLVSNEDSYVRVVGDLAGRDLDRGVFVGVGPDQNFSLVAAARPVMAMVVDFRRRNLLLHLIHKALMMLSPSRQTYLSRLTARPCGETSREMSGAILARSFLDVPMDQGLLQSATTEVARVLRPLDLVNDDEWPAVATIQAKLAGPGLSARFLPLPGYPTMATMMAATDRRGQPAHFLASEDRYHRVRDLQNADRFLPVVGDFAADDGALRRIAAWMERHGQKLSVVYVSDVEFFLLRGGRFDAYVANLVAMPRLDSAVIVRTSTRPIDHPDRVRGDSVTTIVRSLGGFLADALAGKIREADDLFTS